MDYSAELDSEVYLKTLQRYLGPLIDRNSSNLVVSAACGKFHELDTVLDFFPSAQLVGVDNDSSEIKGIKTDSQRRARARIIHGDAKELSSLIDGKADVMLIRHPASPGLGWAKIFLGCFAATKVGGYVLSTGYNHSDGDANLRKMRYAGYKILMHEKNPDGFVFGHSLMACGIDTYATLGMKTGDGLLRRMVSSALCNLDYLP